MNNYVYQDGEDKDNPGILIPRYKALGRTAPNGKVYPTKPLVNGSEDDLVLVRSIISKKDGDANVVTPDLIDNKKFKSCFGFKAKMLQPDEVETLTGHKIGGVCPFAVPENVKVYTDISLKRFSTVFPACGSSNSAIELTCEELYKFSNSIEWVDVCAFYE